MLVPYPAILKKLFVACYQLRGKRLFSKKDNRGILFANTVILLLQRLERNHGIPFILRNTIWQITENHVYGLVGNILHQIQAVAMHKFHNIFTS